jgi:hypothetical protein
VFYYLIASEIWLDKRVAFGGSGIIRGGLLYANMEANCPHTIVFQFEQKHLLSTVSKALLISANITLVYCLLSKASKIILYNSTS